jgi:hypothetical protein
MSTDRFPDAHLHDLAKLGDGRADSLVAELGDELVDAATREGRLRRDDRSDLEKRRSVFPQLLREIARDVDSGLNPALKGLLLGGGETGGGDDSDGDIGPKIDEMRVRHAQSLFEEHGLPVVTALFHAALPEAYLGRRGVQVLDITGELVSNWTRRIRETGQFLINVLSPTPDTADAATSLSPGQPAAIAVRRVRLTHAAVRWLLLAPDESEFAPLTLRNFSGTPNAWQRRLIDVGADSGGNGQEGDDADPGLESVPLNQEDLLATLGTFTTVTLDALAKLAVRVDDHDREAFHHLWNVVGWHLGIGDSLTVDAHSTGYGQAPAPTWPSNRILPIAADEMDALYGRLSARLQGSTDQGKRLAKALTRELASPLPGPLQGAPPVIVRYMVGDRKADMLEIEKGGYAELLTVRTGMLGRLARGGTRGPLGSLTVSLISQMLTRYALRSFVAQARGSERGLRIDPGIAAGWGVPVGPEEEAPPGP